MFGFIKKKGFKKGGAADTQTTGTPVLTSVLSTRDNSVANLSVHSDPFRTPPPSNLGTASHRPGSEYPADSADGSLPVIRNRKFKSARLRPGEYDDKPWVRERDPRRKWEKIIFWGSVGIGFAIGCLLFYFAYASVTNLDYCLAFEDDFQTLDPQKWNWEVQRGGFGTGTFEWTTTDPKNSYVDADGLHIVPSLTIESTNITEAQLENNYVLNLTETGTCTATDKNDCFIRSNKTSGAIVNPVRSARLNTKGKASIKYGRVEVVAKMPVGNWLWPAIWMLPEDNVYGPWPASGEIDIGESRGNAGSQYPDGRDSVSGSLHWGPIPYVDAFWRTTGKHNLQRQDFSQGFHTYGLEWNENYLFIYLDSRLLQIFFIKFTQPMWNLGQFGESIINHTTLFNPWATADDNNAPFDQDFFLILNVAVGGTNGYFEDGVANKPWADASPKAASEFWDAQTEWWPTWGEGNTKGLTVQSVKMWKQGACGSKPT